jgi:hypothetical protein
VDQHKGEGGELGTLTTFVIRVLLETVRALGSIKLSFFANHFD